MKTADEVQERVRFLLIQELDRRVEELSQRLPHRCIHNHLHQLDARKLVDGERNFRYNSITNDAQTMGLCMYGSEDPERWPGDICEDEIDAKRCPWFEPIRGKDAELEHFEAQLRTDGWIEDNMPELAQLLWVLDDEGTVIHGIPWWKKLWYRLLRIRVEPVARVELPLALLEKVVEGDVDAGDGS